MYLFSTIPEGYKELTLSNDESYEKYDHFCWNGETRLPNWTAPKIEWLVDEFSENSDIEPDIASMSGLITLNEKAKEALSNLIGSQVEFLPTIGPSSTSKWYLLNITNRLDIMDVSKSRFKIKKNGKIGVCEHAFITAPSGPNQIFEVKGFEPHIFAGEKLKNTIDSLELKGALLREYLNPE